METAGLAPSRSSLESDLTCDVLKSIVVIGEGLEALGLPFCSFDQLSEAQLFTCARELTVRAQPPCRERLCSRGTGTEV